MNELNRYQVVRILQVEGNNRHAERVRLQLYASGLRCAIQCVRSREDYLSSLDLFRPDLVLIGGGLPALDTLSAERIATERSPHMPIVFSRVAPPAGLGLVVLGAMLRDREVRRRCVADADRRAA